MVVDSGHGHLVVVAVAASRASRMILASLAIAVDSAASHSNRRALLVQALHKVLNLMNLHCDDVVSLEIVIPGVGA